MYQGAADAGAKKASLSFIKTFQLAIAAGTHIGFGAYLALTVGGACFGIATDNPGLQKMILGAFGLPLGLMMSVVTGAEVFTGNTALVTTAVMEGKASWTDLIKNWSASYLGNFVGSLILAYLAFYSGTLGTGPAAAAIATAKCSLTWQMAFVRGLLCNWLIAMAVYIASGCSSMTGKMVAIWFPISAFVALGLDNSVANMFLIPLGILRGAPITIRQMLIKNLIPVTLGNIVGGAICAMAPFGVSHGKWISGSTKNKE
jgi:formate/nitrite transporter